MSARIRCNDNSSISGGNVDFTLAGHVYLNSTANVMVIANKGLASSSIRDALWNQVEPYLVPGDELTAQYAFLDLWESLYGTA